MPFVAPKLAGNVRPIVEAAFGFSINSAPGTWQWTDITKYVQLNDGGGPATLSAGAPDQAQDADPSQIVITLKNTDGRFTALNPNSPYWPNVVRNVPLRFSITWDGASAVYELLTAFVNGWPIQPNAGVLNVTVPITATGRLRRLRASNAEVVSALRGSVPGYSPMRSYWPLENGDLTSPMPGVANAVISGHPTWAATTGFPGSDTLPVFNTNTAFSAAVTGSFLNVGWQVDWYMLIPESPAAAMTLMQAIMPGISEFGTCQVVLNSNSTITAALYDFFGGLLGSFNVTITPTTEFFGQWQHFRLNVRISGSNRIVSLATLPVDGSDGVSGSMSNIGNDSQRPLSLRVPRNVNMVGVQFGHPMISDGTSNPGMDGAGDGWSGELAPDRVTRLCAENNIPVTVTTSGSIAAQAMGPQTIATLSTNLDDCSNTDNGLLHDAGTSGNLAYVSGTMRYNAAAGFTLNYLTRQIGDGLAATYDDQQLVTDWTISRSNGITASFQDPTATDDYARSGTISAATDTQCFNMAGWRVHLGTYDAYRIAGISVDIRGRSPELAQFVTPLTLPTRISPTNLPSPYPPQSFDQFIEGWSMLVDSVTWQINFNCSPYMPWAITVVDSATTGLVSSNNSTLVANMTAISTAAFTVNVGKLWTVAGGDFPFDIGIGGERIRISAISGGSSPQTFTIAAGGRAINGVVKAHNAADKVDVWTPAIAAL